MAELNVPALNKVILAGRLTRDAEMRFTSGGVGVANLGLAVNRRYKDQSGEWKDDTCFVNVVVWDSQWNKQAERLSPYLKKGRAILVEGRLQSRSWDTKEGEKRSVLEVRADRVDFLDRAPRNAEVGAEPVAGARENLDASGGGGDDIPF
jgi:single-strand DNA-binding protein